jgi:hypothetical protein
MSRVFGATAHFVYGAAAVGYPSNRGGGSTVEEMMIRLNRQVDRLLGSLERMQLEEYLNYVRNWKRLLWVNFVSGLARGLGMAIGFTVLGAAAVVLLQRIVVDNIPWIGDFLAEVIRMAQKKI